MFISQGCIVSGIVGYRFPTYAGLRTKHLLNLHERTFELLYSLVFQFGLLAQRIDDLIETLDVLLVLDLFLTDHAQLVN
jgi:hypothetical protein